MVWVNVRFVVRTLKQGILRNFLSSFARTIIIFLNFPQVETTLAYVHNLIVLSGPHGFPRQKSIFNPLTILNTTEHISN